VSTSVRFWRQGALRNLIKTMEKKDNK